MRSQNGKHVILEGSEGDLDSVIYY